MVDKIIKCIVCDKLKKKWRKNMCSNCYIKQLKINNPEFAKRRKLQKKQHYQLNKESIITKCCDYAKLNREPISARKRNWRERTNKEVSWNNNRFKTDINYRVYHLFGSYVRDSIKRGYATPKFEKVTGGSFEDFIKRIESMFREGMSWDNYGVVWNIDHIVSRRKFKYKTIYDVEFKKFWSLSNVQPLFVKENMRKQELLEVPK